MDIELANIFNESFERCKKQSNFLDLFYEYFLSSSEEVRDKFVGTDMKSQKEVLLISLSYMMMASTNPTLLSKISEKHNIHNRNIPPHLYNFWLESMIKTVSDIDREFNHHVEIAWREILSPGIEFMISKYDS